MATPYSQHPLRGHKTPRHDTGDERGATAPLGGRLNKFADPLGQVYQYTFDTNNNLSSVTYPDSTVKTYLYENPTFPNALTGITDENAIRYATYGYDATGRATSESLSGGADAATLSFGTTGGNASTTVTDALGTARTYHFNTILGVQKSTGSDQPAGSGCGASASALTYDSNGNVASRTDFDGYKTTYTYDLTRNLETQRSEGLNGDGSARFETRTISTQWNVNWRLPRVTAEPLKLTTVTYFGDAGTSSCAPAGASTALVCSRTEQATTDVSGSAGLSPAVTGTPRTWSFTYNQYGQVLTANGPRTDVADTTTYTYYAANDASLGKRGNLATVTDALGHVTSITAYDANGRPLTVVDPNNVTLTFTYFPRGWLHTSSVGGQTTTYVYDNAGQLTRVTRPDASHVDYGYDPAHRLTSISDTTLNTVSFTLDPLGNVLSTTWTNPDASTAQAQSANYDALGRLYHAIATRNAVNYTTTFGYDANGNSTTVTDPKSKTTSTQYDALNRPTQITDALTGLTTLAYDGRDQLTQFKAPNNATTNFTVDGLGNIKQEVSADRGTLNTTFDAAGNPNTVTDARGIVGTVTYDALNRPLTVSYPTTGENVTYAWDSGTGCSNGVGHLCAMTDAVGTTTFAYDPRGNRLSENLAATVGGTFATSFTYDSADRVVTIITPTNKILTAQRDTNGRIQQLSTSVASQNVNLVSNVQTNAAGNTTGQTFGNGVTQTATYNTDGSASNQTDTPPSSGGGDADVPTLPEWAAIMMGMLLLVIGYRQRTSPLSPRGRGAGGEGVLMLALLLFGLAGIAPTAHADEALTYDANGNVQTKTLPGGTTTYGYDALNRLNSEAGPAKTQSLTYDANDNRLSDGSGSYTYSTNSDRLATINGVNATLDAAGNITQARGYTYAWNQAGQLKTVSLGSTLLATYTYDYKGRRRVKVTTAAAPQGAKTILYFYDLQDHLIAEMTPQGNLLFTYVWRDDTPVSIIVHGTPEKALYLDVDHLGTPIAARNQQGTVVWKWESDAFGSTPPNDDPGNTGTHTTINLRFPGTYADIESGLLYNGARYLDPRLGYLSPDPIGLAGGRNLMTYARQNPLRYTDPQGLQAAPAIGLGLGLYAGAVMTGLLPNPFMPPIPAKSVDDLGGDENICMAENNKATRKKIKALEENVEEHERKIQNEPNCDAVCHWEKEIKAWKERIERLKKRLPGGG